MSACVSARTNTILCQACSNAGVTGDRCLGLDIYGTDELHAAQIDVATGHARQGTAFGSKPRRTGLAMARLPTI